MPVRTVVGDSLDLGGLVSIAKDAAYALKPVTTLDNKGKPVIDGNKNGVTVLSDTVRVFVPHPTDPSAAPIAFYATLNIKREPMNETEAAALTALLAGKDANKAARDAKEAAELQAEKDAMFDKGQDSVIKSLRNIDTLTRGAAILASVQPTGK